MIPLGGGACIVCAMTMPWPWWNAVVPCTDYVPTLIDWIAVFDLVFCNEVNICAIHVVEAIQI